MHSRSRLRGEHRAAPSPYASHTAVAARLAWRHATGWVNSGEQRRVLSRERLSGEVLALRVADKPNLDGSPPSSPTKSDPPLGDRLLELLRESAAPMTPRSLRQASHVRMARVYDALSALLTAGQVIRDGAGYRLPSAPPDSATATHPL